MTASLSPLSDRPAVTVIVPSFNQGAYIADTIESILHQDVLCLEVWVVDGGSRDETLDVLARYTDDPRVHWISEPDRGYADAVNKGLARARGDLVGIQSSDDYYAAGAIREMLAQFVQYPDLALVSGTFVRVDEGGNPVGHYRARRDREWLTVEQCARTLNFPCQSACLFRRDLARRVGGCDLDVDWVADHDLFVRIIAAARHAGLRTLKLDRPWAFVRQHAAQRNCDRFKFVEATVRAHRQYQAKYAELFTPLEQALLMETALRGEYEFRTRRLGQDVRAIPAFVRLVREAIESRPIGWYLSEVMRLMPLGVGRRLCEALAWRLAGRGPAPPSPPLPPIESARWFACG